MTGLAIPQPEYRALMMFDTLPAGCIAFTCMDEHSVPHIRPGEWVVVDTNDRQPRHLELYVIQWENGRRVICQARNSGIKSVERPDQDAWSVGSLKTIRGRAAIESHINAAVARARKGETVPTITGLGWSDGYLAKDGLAKKLVGCVIGLYAPGFEGPTRGGQVAGNGE